MKRIRMMGLCLVAAFALSAIAVSSASAAPPEFKVCAKLKKSKTTKKYEGKYSNKTCSEVNAKGEGEYELESWLAGKKKSFTGKGGAGTLDSYLPSNESEPWAGGTILGKVTCKSAKVKGEVTGPKNATAIVEFKTCTSEGKKCKSAGAPTGTIKTEKLGITLGYIDSGKAVGALVEGGAGGADPSAEFTCEGLELLATGSVIGVVSGNINTISKTYSLAFAVNAKGGQEVVFGEFPEGITGSAHYLDTFIQPTHLHLPSGEDTTALITGEEAEVYAPGA